jgi:hypothetical protein
MRRAGVLSTISVVLCENICERSELRAKRSPGVASTHRAFHATRIEIAVAIIMEKDRIQHGRASVARNAGVISLAVMASRILGLVRDQVFV